MRALTASCSKRKEPTLSPGHELRATLARLVAEGRSSSEVMAEPGLAESAQNEGLNLWEQYERVLTPQPHTARELFDSEAAAIGVDAVANVDQDKPLTPWGSELPPAWLPPPSEWAELPMMPSDVNTAAPSKIEDLAGAAETPALGSAADGSNQIKEIL